MKIRSTENRHDFQERLYRRLNAYSLQGLLMNKYGDFSAGVEAIEYDDDEPFSQPFSDEEIKAKYTLTKELHIPLYFIYYRNQKYRIYLIEEKNGSVCQEFIAQTSERGFVTWWGDHKGTIQTKPLKNGAGERAGETIFDSTLRKGGLEWGGNIDGFIVSRDRGKIECIIDNISVSVDELTGVRADPNYWFKSKNVKHGPKYEGWRPSVKLSNVLNVPHMILTVDKKFPQKEHVGIAFISELDPDGLVYFENSPPYKHVMERSDVIVSYCEKLRKIVNPPKVKEKTYGEA